jgi:hypothetical protein
VSGPRRVDETAPAGSEDSVVSAVNDGHLDEVQVLLDLAGADDLYAYLGAARDASSEQLDQALRQRREWAQSNQASTTRADEARALIRLTPLLRRLLVDEPEGYRSLVEQQQIDEGLDKVETMLRGALVSGNLSHRAEATVRRLATQLGLPADEVDFAIDRARFEASIGSDLDVSHPKAEMSRRRPVPRMPEARPRGGWVEAVKNQPAGDGGPPAFLRPDVASDAVAVETYPTHASDVPTLPRATPLPTFSPPSTPRSAPVPQSGPPPLLSPRAGVQAAGGPPAPLLTPLAGELPAGDPSKPAAPVAAPRPKPTADSAAASQLEGVARRGHTPVSMGPRRSTAASARASATVPPIRSVSHALSGDSRDLIETPALELEDTDPGATPRVASDRPYEIPPIDGGSGSPFEQMVRHVWQTLLVCPPDVAVIRTLISSWTERGVPEDAARMVIADVMDQIDRSQAKRKR